MKQAFYLTSISIAFLLVGCASYIESPYEDYSYYEDSYQEPELEYSRDDWNCSTDDCAGHEAGYTWAEENGITDPDDCGGNSDSFIEGCQTWAEEQQMEEIEYYENDYQNDLEYDYY